MYPNLWGGGHIDSGLDPIRSDFISPNLQRGGHIDFGEYPVGTFLSCKPVFGFLTNFQGYIYIYIDLFHIVAFLTYAEGV